MKVALSIPVEHDGATFEFVVPDAVMSRLLPLLVTSLGRLPEEARAALLAGEQGDVDETTAASLGALLLDSDLLALIGEAFDAGVVEWHGVDAADGSPLACSPKNKAYIPLLDKFAVVFGYLGKQRVLAAKKEPAT